MTSSSNEQRYFDIHTSGRGYIQRARRVPIKSGRKGQSFLACTVAALVGPADKPTLRYFDVKVSGSAAQKLVEQYIGVDDVKKRPLVEFRLGDLWVDPFIRPRGEHQGEAAASLKARLLKATLLDPAELKDIESHELITRGIGYLNRVKDVNPTNGDPFLACTIAALSGPVEGPEYRYFDTIVDDADAAHLVRRCMAAVEEDKKVLIAFRLNDMVADAYIRTQGERAGEPGGTMESKLIHVGFIKIDGQLEYSDKADADVVTDAQASEDVAEAADEIAAHEPVAESKTTQPKQTRAA